MSHGQDQTGVMEKSPAVSVIIPAFLSASYIAQALASVFSQSFRDFEVIVVNDGSPDTPQFERELQAYAADVVYIKQRNCGPSHARNTGIERARAPLIALLDADDFWARDFLATQVGILTAEPTADAVYSNAALFGDPRSEGKTYMDDVLPSEGEVSFLSLVSGKCNIVGAAMVLRRSAIVRAGLYDPGISLGEDFDLWLRFVKSGGRIVYHRRALYHMRVRADSLSSQTMLMCESVLRVLDQSEKRFALTDAERVAVEEARWRVAAEIALGRSKRAFFAGDVAGAVRDLGIANDYYRLRKLRLVRALMKTVPSLLKLVERMRSRF